MKLIKKIEESDYAEYTYEYKGYTVVESYFNEEDCRHHSATVLRNGKRLTSFNWFNCLEQARNFIDKAEDKENLMNRLTILPGRMNGKSAACLAEAVAQMKKNYPDAKKIAYMCRDRKSAEKVLKNNPNIVRKGRWLYYKYNNELLYIKVFEIKQPEGFKTVKIERLKDYELH